MITEIEILESKLTFNDNDCILLTDENKDIIGRKLEEQGYTWLTGDMIQKSIHFQSGHILYINKEDKYVLRSGVFADMIALNYKFIKIDL